MANSSTGKANGKVVESITHYDATRKNIPTAEYQSVMRPNEQSPIWIAYKHRNRYLDPQLVWRGMELELDGGLNQRTGIIQKSDCFIRFSLTREDFSPVTQMMNFE